MKSKSKGLGDSVEKVLKATGIDKVAKKILGDDCGCEERKQKLNKLFPYIKNADDFTLDEQRIFKETYDLVIKTNKIEQAQRVIFNQLHQNVLGIPASFNNCGSCNEKTINKLKKIYDRSCKI